MGSEMVYRGDEEGEVELAASYLPEVANEHTDGWIRVLEPVGTLAAAVAGTEFVPKALRNKPEAVTAAILFGRELEMPPMQALSQIYMVEGKATLSAEHMRAMVFAAGHEITYPVYTGRQVIARGRRRYSDGTWSAPQEVEWNYAMADYAKLLGKDNWKKYPRAMLTARATADLCRLLFPDVTHGLLAAEELADGGETPEGGGVLDPGSEEPKAKVSRSKVKAVASKPAPAPASDTPRSSGSVVGAPPRPPLPGTVKAGGSAGTSGEGPASAPEDIPSEPADPAPFEPNSAGGPQPGDICRYGRDGVFCVLEVGHNGRHELGRTLTGEDVVPPWLDMSRDARPLDFSDDYDSHLARVMERTSYLCPDPQQYHPGHTFNFDGQVYACPGLVTERCSQQASHTHHRWATTRGFYWCDGREGERMSEGDGSPDDMAATGLELPERPMTVADGYEPRHCANHDTAHDTHTWEDDDGYLWTCSGLINANVAGLAKTRKRLEEEAERGGAVPDRADGISPGQKRALEAAFGSLKVKDRAEVHHTCSALLGRKVETLSPLEGDNAGLTSADASKLIKALSKVEDRDALEALIQQAAEDWGRDGA